MRVIERIRAAAAEFGDRLAHTDGARSFTYAELWGRANALAAHLEKRYANGAEPVAIRGHKEPEMLVGFLGSVLAGRAYIPLDQSLPEERVQGILATAAPVIVLTPDEIARLSGDWKSLTDRPLRKASEDDPFYIIFTSGSTGNPKGVVITHGCLAAFVGWMLDEQKITRGAETFLNQAPFSFDLSVMDLYLSLVTGGTLFSLTKEDIADPRALYAKFRTSGVTTWVSTPSFAQMCLVERSFDASMMPEMKRFLFCGEALAHKTASALLERFPKAEVWNTYGPTEATVATTSVRVDEALLKQYDPLPIGVSRPGSQVFIRTEEGEMASDGERGEIIITGPNVSPGYLARPDLTSQAFFNAEGVCGYKTGDRGYALGEMLFFEGRMDFQVKVRGYRIELGDVESHLREVSGVIEAVVLPVERRGVCESLAAFIVMREKPESETDTAKTLRDALGKKLPDYMLPRKVIFLEAFPMTPNGKADRRALAAKLT